jgi:hypothetical protein
VELLSILPSVDREFCLPEAQGLVGSHGMSLKGKTRMTLRKSLKDPSTQIRMGLVALILASLSKWFLQPGARLSDGWTDGITGFLYGVAIGLMLLGIWRKARPGSSQSGL